MALPIFATTLRSRLPFYYGWVVLACVCCAGFARQGPAVATLSIFVAPLSHEFGWSRTAISGAASLGGLLAAVAAPWIGPLLDRRGARLVLCAAVLVNGVVLAALSLTSSLTMFYLLFCIIRLNWAAPFELGLYGAISNWFVARRTFAASIAALSQAVGLAAMPLVAQGAILHQGWRAGWLALGAVTLTVGLVPAWLLLVRRPEDLGLVPDGPTPPVTRSARRRIAAAEPAFSRRQALRTPAFWLLLLYTMLVYPVQAGVSLHQAPFLIERGIDATIAATIVSAFSGASALASLVCATLPRAIPVRYPLAAAGALLATGPLIMLQVHGPATGYAGAAVFGFGLGGMMTLVPIAWADYFGRAHFGAIRGIALPAQVLAQAAGPLISGALRDLTGDYRLSLMVFAVVAALSIVTALLARQPAIGPDAVQLA
ncbi:MAG: MFS transporter [Alphaproteobacteria bacterium]|nr:MFS transporter [Alphaproteobacteria bacterium]